MSRICLGENKAIGHGDFGKSDTLKYLLNS